MTAGDATATSAGQRALAYPNPSLTDGRVLLRRWREDDLGCIRAASRDPDITRATSVPERFTPDEGLAFIHRQWSRATDGVGVSQAIIDLTSYQAVGLVIVSARPQPGVGGLGYWIIPSARGRGIATRAVRLVAPWALATLRWNRLEAWVAPDNAAALRVLTAGGFQWEGRLRRFFDSPTGATDALVFSRISSGRPPVAIPDRR